MPASPSKCRCLLGKFVHRAWLKTRRTRRGSRPGRKPARGRCPTAPTRSRAHPPRAAARAPRGPRPGCRAGSRMVRARQPGRRGPLPESEHCAVLRAEYEHVLVVVEALRQPEVLRVEGGGTLTIPDRQGDVVETHATFTPVISSETSHSMRATDTSRAPLLGATRIGWPRPSAKPSGPMYMPPSRPGSVAA
jgi:hypothetical protein